MPAIHEGATAPDFTLATTAGGNFTLSRDARGKAVILYFYPQDFTPLCTAEACSFRDEFQAFRGLDVLVLGISKDDIESHRKFKAQHHLPFELLADPNHKVAKLYHAISPVFTFASRATFLLDEQHRIAYIYRNIFSGKGHIEAMLAKLKTKA